jgi:hypothetical protein
VGTELDETAFVPEEEMAAPAPKPSRKRKSERIDSQTELTSAKITEGLNDTSDITAERQSTPLTKRQMLHAQLEDKDWMEDMLAEPASIGMSHKLLALFRRTATLEPPEVAPPEKKKEEAEEEEKKEIEEEGVGVEVPQGTEETGILPEEPSFFEPELPDRTTDEETRMRIEDEDEEAQARARQDEREATEKPPTAKELIARTQKMYALLKKKFEAKDSLSFGELLGDSATRATAAGNFYQLLVLKTEDYVQVLQPKPYGDITITTTTKFGQPLRMAAAH